MTNYALLSDPKELIGKQWSKDPSPERRLLLGLARDGRLLRGRDLEYYLAELKKEEPPRSPPSFQNLQEAEAWLHSQPDSFRWAWVSIVGEIYLAAHYPNIHHRALYPLSMAEGSEVEDDDPPHT